MKRTDNTVFFFTLIDFLLQAIFCGLFLFVVFQAASEAQNRKAEAISQVEQRTGISDLVELIDRLTRLVPADQLKALFALLEREGGLTSVQAAVNTVDELGGVVRVKHGMERVRKWEEGFGKPPCYYSEQNGKRIPMYVATFVASEDRITLDRSSPQFDQLLQEMRLSASKVGNLGLEEFGKAFSPVLKLKSDCRIYVRLVETSRYIEPRDAVQRVFVGRTERAK